MVKIKVCGLKRFEDVRAVNEFKPDYVGFIFAQSKRQVSVDYANLLIKALDDDIKKVGVFVNESIKNIIETAIFLKLDCIQLHGDEDKDFILKLKEKMQDSEYNDKEEYGILAKDIQVWKAIRIKDQDSLNQIANFHSDAIVLDTFIHCGNYGGLGIAFDWNMVKETNKSNNIILAGGLSIENVEKAIKTVWPYMVDVSSGVETNELKDREKIRDFIAECRKIDNVN